MLSPLAKLVRLALLVAATALGFSAAAAAESQRRVALVIGNSAYDNSPLVNSANDARAMAEVLRDAGFLVLLRTDADQRQMQQALREFGERLNAEGGTGLFYYAGHGMQIKGRNFLIPVRSDIAHEDEVAYTALDTQAVLDKMESAGNGTNIVILDACRNNPFARSLRSGQQGLAQMDAPAGTLISFATAPGSVAIDNLPGMKNGLFTTHLLEAIRRPGLKVEEVMKQVRSQVLRASGNKQMPWESSALVGDFYFHPPRGEAGAAAAPSAAPVVDLQAAADAALWEAVRNARTGTEILTYLNRFPSGRHAGDARRRLLEITDAAPGAAISTTLRPPPGDPEPQLRLDASAAQLTREFDAGMASARLPGDAQTLWGERTAGTRPAQPLRNARGFSVGDRFRYRITDLRGAPYARHYLWKVDRIEADGSVWINEGRQRLDARGQRRGGNDEFTGAWLDLSPPLPLAEVLAQGPGREGNVSTSVTERAADGQLRRITFDGTWRTAVQEVDGPRHLAARVDALLVEVSLLGTVEPAEASRRFVRWLHRYWFAPGLLLPVRITTEEVSDSVLVHRALHELVAVDQLGPAAAWAAAR